MIERESGHTGNISFVCDVCDNHIDTHTDEFNEALAIAKSHGLKLKKIGDEWIHYCSAECMKD